MGSQISIEARSSVQICASSISIISSAIILYMILCSKHRFSTPYPRIVFGLSVGDLFMSLAILLGPFASPNGSYSNPWSVGNVHTCNVDGFLLFYGLTSVPMYLLLLSIYHYATIVRRVSKYNFYTKIERHAHIVIHLVTLVVSLYLLASKSFNPLGEGVGCAPVRYPQSCWSDNTQCTRGEHSVIIAFISPLLTSFIACIGSFVLFTLIYRHVFKSESNMNRDGNGDLQNDETRCYRFFSLCRCKGINHEQEENEGDLQYFIRLWTRESAIQAALYMWAFLITFGFTLFTFILRTFKEARNPVVIQLIFARTLWPLMGLFNLLTYIRPKVIQTRLTHPELSWFRTIYLTIKTAGDVPDEITDSTFNLSMNSFNFCCCHRNRDHDEAALRVTDISTPSQGALFRSSTQGISRISVMKSVFVVQLSFDEESRVILEAVESGEE